MLSPSPELPRNRWSPFAQEVNAAMNVCAFTLIKGLSRSITSRGVCDVAALSR